MFSVIIGLNLPSRVLEVRRARTLPFSLSKGPSAGYGTLSLSSGRFAIMGFTSFSSANVSRRSYSLLPCSVGYYACLDSSIGFKSGVSSFVFTTWQQTSFFDKIMAVKQTIMFMPRMTNMKIVSPLAVLLLVGMSVTKSVKLKHIVMKKKNANSLM